MEARHDPLRGPTTGRSGRIARGSYRSTQFYREEPTDIEVLEEAAVESGPQLKHLWEFDLPDRPRAGSSRRRGGLTGAMPEGLKNIARRIHLLTYRAGAETIGPRTEAVLRPAVL